MNRIYQKIDELDLNCVNVVATVIDGPAFGEKAIFSDHKLVFETEEQGFFSKNRDLFDHIEGCGIKEIDGTNVFCEVLGQEKKLVICGGGHVSVPVIKMGMMMGYSVTVLEDRPKFANNARKAGAAEVICDSFENGLRQIKGDPDTFFVIVTRGHRYDQVCLRQIIQKEHAYIGMIGSRLRVAKVKEILTEEGVDREILEQVHTPIGLSIGAETPEEIAVAIMAEIIEVKNKKRRNAGYTRKMMKEILRQSQDGMHRVLTTIVRRKGSAPRETGTQMLVLPDGNNFGTIGGGCVESDVIQRAIRKIRTGDTTPDLVRIDMTGQDAEDEGMVCGGIVDILFEVL